MIFPGSNGERYEVHCAGVIAKRLQQIQRKASLQGRGEAVLVAFRQMIRRLIQDPMNLGEPLYRLPVLRMQIRSCVIRPLVLDFAVCEDRPLVFIKGVELLANTNW